MHTLAALLLLAAGASAKFSHGILSSSSDVSEANPFENWMFLDRFCFVSQLGQVHYAFYFPLDYAPQDIYLYYDSPDQWRRVHPSDMTCEEKRQVLNRDNNQIIRLTDSHGVSTEDTKCDRHQSPTGEVWLNCSGTRTFISARERWWYFVLANCNSSRGVYAEYNLTMTNERSPAHYIYYHFSADEFLILPTDMVFMALQTAVFLVSIGIAMVLRQRQMLHATYKLYLFSIILECASLICDVFAAGQYSKDGIGCPFIRYCGQLLRVASVLIFMLLLILLAKGWTVTRGRLSSSSSTKIATFMLIFAVVYASLFIYQMKAFDPAEVLYIYQSPVGYVIIVMRIVAWLWFDYAVYFTLKHYPEKRQFYYRFTAVFSAWFWAGPIIIVCCNYVFDPWCREKIANGVENAVALFGFIVFLYMTRPSAANSTFPYHVRTTQIEAINEACAKNADYGTDLPHHVYEVQYSADKDEVFTISSRRAAQNGGYQGSHVTGGSDEEADTLDGDTLDTQLT